MQQKYVTLVDKAIQGSQTFSKEHFMISKILHYKCRILWTETQQVPPIFLAKELDNCPKIKQISRINWKLGNYKLLYLLKKWNKIKHWILQAINLKLEKRESFQTETGQLWLLIKHARYFSLKKLKIKL